MTRGLATSGLLALLVFGGVACSDASPGISVAIAGQFRRSNGGLVDLAEANPKPWQRVCVLGSYSVNADAKKLLGFDWDAEHRTSIRENDGIMLLLFVQGKQVVDFVEHPRNLGNFFPVGGKCFARAQARFQQMHERPGRPAGLYPLAD